MIGLFVFLGIVLVYTGLALLIERRNGQPSHEHHMHSVAMYSSGNWSGGGFGGGEGGFGGGGGDCGGGFGGGDCGGF